MFDFFNKNKKNNVSQDNIEELALSEVKLDMELFKINVKEDSKFMGIQCNYTNQLPQIILMVRKKYVADSQNVGIRMNLSSLDSFKVIKESFKDYIDIQSPCGGDVNIKGEVLLDQVILSAGVAYSMVLYDKQTETVIYDSETQFKTAYSLYEVVPSYTDVNVDQDKVTANFKNIKLEQIEVTDDNVDFYLYKVSGEVELVVQP